MTNGYDKVILVGNGQIRHLRYGTGMVLSLASVWQKTPKKRFYEHGRNTIPTGCLCRWLGSQEPGHSTLEDLPSGAGV